ncbi:acyl-CoA carboxylase subunit epsilon [Arthrobacter sp.]|uniref:acyl-CoA carboxylase subunit epsilon n=1 Tax=Arthrobacter sp. TaxID=1667 RepID=UPI0026DFFFD7|nr:acyl-CoA carboxylase subunit epsilon [Arthrobacter sp.]MDO5753745.1 acyl-CoA carboxylase subunit epsilon [Arthrobacter sp.]
MTNDQTPVAEPAETSAAEPLLSVSHGQPTVEELAAVTAVVLALQSAAENDDSPAPSRHWARREQLHLPPKPGAGAWRRSSGR